MATVEQLRASYRRAVRNGAGETVEFRRVENGMPVYRRRIHARITAYRAEQPNEADLTIGQSDVVVLEEDFRGIHFPMPVQTGGRDRIVRDPGTDHELVLIIEAVDDRSARFKGEIIAYRFRVSG